MVTSESKLSSEYCKIEMYHCKVTFTAMQPVKNNSTIRQWEAKLTYNHYDHMNYHCEYDRFATLATASFCLISIEKLSHVSESYPGLSDVVDADEFFDDVLYLEKVEAMDNFRGFGYEYCLVQRIIDNYDRDEDSVIIIPQSKQTTTGWEKMGFKQMKSSPYWLRNQRLRPVDPVAKCVQSSSEKQQIEIAQLATGSNDDSKSVDELEINEDSDHDSKSVDVDMDLCFVEFTSTQNAENDMLEEDYSSFWNAKLIYQTQAGDTILLANARFWVVYLIRLLNDGAYDHIFTVFDAPCQALCNLFCSVMIKDRLDGPFKLHKSDRINNFKVRVSKEVLEKLQNNHCDLDAYIESVWNSDEMNEGGGGNILYLDKVEVNKAYGGFGYGRCLTQIIIDNHARGFDSVVLKPFPLQWERKEPTEENEQLFEFAQKKVIRVWENMWFYKFGGPDSCYWGRSEAWTHPKMEEFCKCLQSTSVDKINNSEKICGNNADSDSDDMEKQPSKKILRTK